MAFSINDHADLAYRLLRKFINGAVATNLVAKWPQWDMR